jgi:hypothetical protein
MKTTDSKGLPYPESIDIGNGASYLQALAEAIETRLVAEDALLTEIESPDMVIMRRSSDQTGIGASGYVDIQWNQVLFDNKGAMTGVTLPAAPRMTRSGVYGFGVYIPTTVTGAATANTRRNVKVSWNFVSGPSAIDVYDYFLTVDSFESLTSGEFQTFYSTAEIPGSVAGTPVSMTVSFLHTNTGATVNVLTGAYAFYHRIRPLEVSS